MTAPKSRAVGETVKVADGATVTRPEGFTLPVTGGTYVLDVPGVFVVDGSEVTVK